MLPLDHVLALAVLIAPLNAGEPTLPCEHHALRPTIQSVALSLEVLDPREIPCVLDCADTFDSDLVLVRRRHFELGDAPPLCDAWRFPSREIVCHLLALNRARHRDWTLKKEAFGGDTYDEALAQTDRLYKVYDAVRDARSEFYYVSVRRQALALLRQMIGVEAYHRGELPPAVPAWFRD